MIPSRLLPRQLVSTERRRSIVITLVWGLSIALVYMQALYSRSALADTDLGLVCGLCLLAGIVLSDFAGALIGYFAALTIGVATSSLLYTLPFSMWALPPDNSIALSSITLTVVFKSTFPFPFLMYLVVSIIGSAIGEKYFT